jgi:hypothetical protein
MSSLWTLADTILKQSLPEFPSTEEWAVEVNEDDIKKLADRG